MIEQSATDWVVERSEKDARLTLARLQWGRGPWQDEPDLVIWQSSGLKCAIARNDMGCLCGYVRVPDGHVCHGLDYNHAHDIVASLECHGGLTYSRSYHPCGDGEDGGWWLGFDCGHGGDGIPYFITNGFARGLLGDRNCYRDIGYVRSEVEALARQLARWK